MKLKEDLLERVRKGELIVENDNKDVINLIFSKHNDLKFYVFKHNGFVGGNILYDHEFCKPIIKASELIEKEDYTKPLGEGRLCVFFDDCDSFCIRFYQKKVEVLYPQSDYIGMTWKYAFPYNGETQQGLQDKIYNYLKDK